MKWSANVATRMLDARQNSVTVSVRSRIIFDVRSAGLSDENFTSRTGTEDSKSVDAET
jgi:hypothetical protein